jgi:hypothetical protein
MSSRISEEWFIPPVLNRGPSLSPFFACGAPAPATDTAPSLGLLGLTRLVVVVHVLDEWLFDVAASFVESSPLLFVSWLFILTSRELKVFDLLFMSSYKETAK